MAIARDDLDAYWMPFTANRDFKKEPRIITGAQGHHYTTESGETLYDMFSGLWTSGAGHCHPKIVEAVQTQVAELDYALGFQVSNDKSFELARRVTDLAPEGFSQCFFTNSGSESVDTALKIALAYHRAKGEGTRTRLIGRERGYHGVNFGGISVGGSVPNRTAFSANLIPGTSAGKRAETESQQYQASSLPIADHPYLRTVGLFPAQIGLMSPSDGNAL